MQNTTPYTYIIGWVEKKKWYIGVRTANKVRPEDDLWIHYFTSSKTVKRLRKEFGEPDFILVDEVFECPYLAVDHEAKCISKVMSRERDKWLNRNIGGRKYYWDKSRKHSKDVLKRLSEASKGRILSETHKSRISSGMKSIMTPTRRSAMSERNKSRSPEIQAKISASMKRSWAQRKLTLALNTSNQ